MKIKNLLSIGIVVILAALATTGAYGQGRGHSGGGGGRPAGVGGGPPTGTGVDRGLGNASNRSGGRSDDGLNNAATRSNGRSTTGLERARMASDRANSMSDTDLNRYRGLSKKLGTTPEQMRAAYQAALMTNPDLNYGQFVAANVVADNLHGRFPAITSSALLAGLANGDSLGRTLQNLGLSHDQAKTAQRTADDQIKSAKERNKDR